MEKINYIIESYVNGNISEFKKELNNLSKLELSNLIIEWTLSGKAHTEVMSIVQRNLDVEKVKGGDKENGLGIDS